MGIQLKATQMEQSLCVRKEPVTRDGPLHTSGLLGEFCPGLSEGPEHIVRYLVQKRTSTFNTPHYQTTLAIYIDTQTI